MKEARRKFRRSADFSFTGGICQCCHAPLVRKWVPKKNRMETPSDYERRKSCMTAECAARFHDGRRQHPLFGIWKGIMRRCFSPSNHAYANYGGRGITVSQEWQDFWTFARDMDGRPPRASVDRIDNNGNYCKQNCRWSNHKEQTRNSRLNKYNMLPPEAPALSAYAPRLGITRQAAWHRIRRFGWEAVWNGAGASKRRPLPEGFRP